MRSQSNTNRAQPMKPIQTIGMIVLVLTAILPALILAGFIPTFNVFTFSFTTWLVIAILGGAVTGLLFTRQMKYWPVGIIAGILIGAGILTATYYYMRWRTTILTIEIVIPMFIGALPGLLLVFAGAALIGKQRRARAALAIRAGQGTPPPPPGVNLP